MKGLYRRQTHPVFSRRIDSIMAWMRLLHEQQGPAKLRTVASKLQ
jgi:hypothetical protein